MLLAGLVLAALQADVSAEGLGIAVAALVLWWLRAWDADLRVVEVYSLPAAALAGGIVLDCRNGCYRDMASMHSSYRRVEETAAALEAIGRRLADLGAGPVHWILDRPVSDPPGWLADPALAVHSPRPANAWPPGTGSWRLHPDALRDGGNSTNATVDRWVAWPEGWTPGDPRPVLRFHARRARDPRELLDAGEDLLVTDDPAVLAYAATLPAVAAVPLPWDRTYALFVGDSTADMDLEGAERAMREALARDAVRAEARASDLRAFGETAPACENVAAPVALRVDDALPALPPSDAAARIVYPREDRTARDLAERLAALSVAPPGPSLPAWVTRLPRVVEGLPGDGFAEALRRRSEAAYVLSLPRESRLPCALRLQPGPGWSLRPLVDARSRVIAADDVVGLAVDGDGTLLLFGAGRTGRMP